MVQPVSKNGIYAIVVYIQGDRNMRSKYRSDFLQRLALARVERLHRISAEQNHRCAYCGKKTWNRLDDDDMTRKERKKNRNSRATIEHVICQKHGGNWGWYNTVMACWRCNNNRGSDFDAYEFYAMMIDISLWEAHCKRMKEEKAERKAIRKKASDVRRAAWLECGGRTVELYQNFN